MSQFPLYANFLHKFKTKAHKTNNILSRQPRKSLKKRIVKKIPKYTGSYIICATERNGWFQFSSGGRGDCFRMHTLLIHKRDWILRGRLTVLTKSTKLPVMASRLEFFLTFNLPTSPSKSHTEYTSSHIISFHHHPKIKWYLFSSRVSNQFVSASGRDKWVNELP